MKHLKEIIAQQSQKKIKLPMFDLALPFIPVVLGLFVLIVTYIFADPAPPSHLHISVARENGKYQEYARRYQEILARDGVMLEIVSSEGTLDSLKQLKDENTSIDIAFTLDGMHEGEDSDVNSLGSISYDPIWFFYKDSKIHNRLSDFTGKRIAIGKPGGGTQLLSKRLLQASGITPNNATLVESGREEAVKLFRQGKVDALFLIGSPETSYIIELALNPTVRTLDFDQADAYSRIFPFLHVHQLPHGTLDLHRNIPPQDARLLTTTTTLLVDSELHPAIVYLLMKAMTEVHGKATLLSKERVFPNTLDADFEISPDAKHYYKSGPPLLHRYLPFWLASLVERVGIVLIPLLAVMIPLVRLLPLAYRWLIKRRINRWYAELLALETQFVKGKDYDEYLRRLDWIEEQVEQLQVPLFFTEVSYVLKEHIDLVRRKMLRYKQSAQG